jgi:hypothetical protein
MVKFRRLSINWENYVTSIGLNTSRETMGFYNDHDEISGSRT